MFLPVGYTGVQAAECLLYRTCIMFTASYCISCPDGFGVSFLAYNPN